MIYIATSTNITAGGQATTALLTPPAGKTTADFSVGRMWDDENGIDLVDIGEAPFDPSALTDLVAWWDASDAASFTLSGSYVETWGDKSANNYDLTNLTIYHPTRTGSLNSLPTVVFGDGANRLGTTTGSNLLADSTGSVIFLMKNDVATYIWDANMFSGADATNSDFGSAHIAFAWGERWGAGWPTVLVRGTWIMSPPVADTSWMIITLTCNGTTATLRRNGTTIGSVANTANFDVDKFTVAPDDPSTGQFAEIIVWNSASLTDVEAVETYLTDKWGI